MTMSSLARRVGARQLGNRLPSANERQAANQLRRIIASQSTKEGDDLKIKVAAEGGEQAEVVLTNGLSTLLMELLRHIGSGDAVTLVPVSQMLTTQQTADILNVSRPFLISLLEKGDIPHVLVGRHRRIKANDLFDYKAQRDKERAAALSELSELDGELI
jgi:excisionase family DNA binding protein